MSKDESEDQLKLNLNVQKKEDSKYKKYVVEDSDSNISEEDIETKMQRLIKIKKAGQKKDTKEKETEEEKLKKEAEKFKKKKEENKKKKEKDKKEQINKGLISFEKLFKNIYKKRFLKSLKNKINAKENIKKGIEKIVNFERALIKKRKKNSFLNLKNNWRKKREEEKKRKEEERKKREEEERKKKEEEEKKRREEEKRRKEEERKKREEDRKKREEERKKREEEKRKKEEEKKKKEKEEREKEEKEKKEKEEREKKEKEKKEKEEKEKKEKEKREKEIKKESEEKKKKSSLKLPRTDKMTPKGENKINLLDTEKTSEKKNEENEKSNDEINTDSKLKKIENKRKKLEYRKKKHEQFLNYLEQQRKNREAEIKNLSEQIDKQENKQNRIEKGLNVSRTDSLVPSDNNLDNEMEEQLSKLYNRKITKGNVGDLKKTKNNEALYDFENEKKQTTQLKSFIRKSTQKNVNNFQSHLNKQQDNNNIDENNNNVRKKSTVRKITIRGIKKSTQREIDAMDEEENKKKEEEELEENDDFMIELHDTYLLDDDDDNRVDEEDVEADKSQLMEYDKFYKEQFFRNDVFNFDFENVHDKEEEIIKKDVERMEMKKKIKEKTKLKDVNAVKGMDVTDLQKEISDLKTQYEKMKKIETNKIELVMNNTEKLLYKGRLLNNYFKDQREMSNIPHFSLESAADKGATEVIDFKPLRVEEQIRRYYDRCCCLKCRKKFNSVLIHARFWCLLIVDNQIFDNFSLLVIVLNTIFILISDPLDPNNLANTSDQYFLYFYTFECILKIITYGFVMTENAYLKDYWNCLDFFVVFVGWISWILERAMNGTKISGLAALRAFRILRPLKTVKSVKGLKKLVIALLASISHLSETTIVLFSFFFLFAIAGEQMWQGNFLKRCMSLNYGYIVSLKEDKGMCTFDSDCNQYNTYGNKFICVKQYRNPDNGVITFDNVLMGFVTVFVCATLEGWSQVFTYVSKTFKDKIMVNPVIIFLFFHFFVLMGGFYLINLFLAVTNSEFEKIETTRKELTEKKSFYKLIKGKYDLKEKEKQEKKKKERALKSKNVKKSGESLRELYYKVDDEAYHIIKNRRDIPTVYSTIKDMYVMSNNNPEELYTIVEMIDDEETHLCKDVKRQQKEIDKLIDEAKKENKNKSSKVKNKKQEKDGEKKSLRRSSEYVANLTSESIKSKDNGRRFGGELEIPNIEEKIYPDAIALSIKETEKYMKEQMIHFQNFIRQVTQLDDNVLKQKLEKKEMERLMKNEIIQLEDLSFEKAIREEEKKNLESQSVKKAKKTEDSSLESGQILHKSSNLFKKKFIKHDRKNVRIKKHKLNIGEELSFLTDLSLSNLNESNNNENETISKDDISLIQNSNSSETRKNQSLSEDNSVIANKEIILDEEEKIKNEIEFKRPSALLPDLMKLKNDVVVREKLAKLREHFNLNDYLQKEQSKGLVISTLGKRKSFLNFLRYDEEKNHLEDINNRMANGLDPGDFTDNMDLSLYGKEDISLSSISLGEVELLPKQIADSERMYNDNLNIDEINKKIESNKYTSIARESIMNRDKGMGSTNLTTKEMQKFYRNINYGLNNNIIIDPKPPRGRNTQLNRSHVFMNIEHPEEINEEFEIQKEKNEIKNLNNDSASLNENGIINISQNKSIQNDKNEDENKRYFYKSPSIEKNLYKFPMFNSEELKVPDENKRYTDPLTVQQDQISNNLRGKKYYMNYLNNIIDKDLKVKDNFKIDHWKGEILGKQIHYIHKKQLPETTEAFFVFNDKKLNLKKYRYSYMKHFEYLDYECAYLTHSLKNLPIQILEIMPPRMRDFGRYAVGKEINMGTLSSKGSSTNISQKTIAQKTAATTKSSRSKSTLILGSAFVNHHRVEDEIRYKKGFYEKIYKKIDEFNYRTLSHYFDNDESLYYKLTDEKRREEKQKEIEEHNKEKDSKIEVKTEVKNIAVFDLKTNSHRYVLSSIPDILYHSEVEDNREVWNKMIESLENFNIIIWNANPGIKRGQKLKYAFYIIAINPYFDYAIILVVIINSFFMALDGNLFRPEVYKKLNISSYVFNSIFFAEYIIKFIGLGPIVYYSDAFTYLDTLIIAFAIVDMVGGSDSTDDEIGKKQSISSSLGVLRVFRIFRVLRLTKVLRKMKSMRLIIVSIKKALANVAYIVCILLMFILIFVLLGMSLLSGNIRYQSFLNAFYVTFQILTGENWNAILYELFPMNELTFFYLLAWIFLGNYIIFNLFTSVLLQSFDDDNGDEDDDPDYDEKVERMYTLPDYLYQIKKKEKEHANRLKKGKSAKIEGDEIENGNSNSYSQSRSGTISMMAKSNNGSESENSESSSMMMSQTQEESQAEEKAYTGVDKSIREWQRVNRVFRRNECENSLYFIPQTNKFRIGCMLIIGNKKFDSIILIMILLSTARLILDTFIDGYVSVLIFDLADVFFNIIFLIECILKVIALGFVMDEGSYLRDNWNKIDLIIVFFSFFDFQGLFTKYLTSSEGGNNSLQWLKVLRLLRTLRPLRFISHNGQLKLIISSLFDSILPICNALFIVLVVFFMFSIVGISLFFSSYHNCYIEDDDVGFKIADSSFKKELPDNSTTMPKISDFCATRYNGIMDTGPTFKFSNILISMVTAYVLSNTEGWPDIMNSYRVYNDIYGLFFIVYILVVSYFFLNLFTGIMFKYFNDAWSREQKVAEGDKKAEKYYDFLQQIESSKPDYIKYVKPEAGTIKYYLRMAADSAILDNGIMIIIFLNMIVMAMNYEGCDAGYEKFLTTLNIFFTSIFIAECVLKLLGYGVIGYFYFGWNKFDFFVVVASIVDLIMTNVDGIDASFLKSFQIIRVLRVLRVTRVLRLVKSLKGLEKLLQTLSWSISALMNVFILMFLIFCIFAILGCYLYDGLKTSKYGEKMVYLNSYYNLNNFYNAFLLVFRSATGEDWPMVMEELAFIDEDKFHEPIAYCYMLFMNFISAVIMLNLFLMVTLQQYDEFTQKSYNPIEKFEIFSEEFKEAWNKYSTPKDKGYRIKKTLITNFFMDFNWKKLNFPETNKLEFIKKYVLDLKLRSDPENFVYYHDVIYRIIVRQMGQSIERENPDNALILKTEKKIGEYVRIIISDYIKSHGITKNTEKNPFKTFNPLTSHLYFKISYIYLKNFINFYKENREIIKQKEEALNSSRISNKNIIIGEKSESSSGSELINIKSMNEDQSKKNLSSIAPGSSNHFVKSNYQIGSEIN